MKLLRIFKRSWHSKNSIPTSRSKASNVQKVFKVSGPYSRPVVFSGASDNGIQLINKMVYKVPVDIDEHLKGKRVTRFSQNIPKGAVKIDLKDDNAEFILRTPEFVHHSVLPKKYLPPLMRPPKETSFVGLSDLQSEQIKELEQRRANDPDYWTVGMLSKEYNISPKLVMSLTGGSTALKLRKKKLLNAETERITQQNLRKTIAEINRERAKWTW